VFLLSCSKQEQVAPVVSPKVSEAVSAPAPGAEGSKPVEKKSVADIKTALKLGTPMVCTVTEENQTSTLYVKGSMMRVDTVPADAHAIYTDDAMYMWEGKEGQFVSLADLKKLGAENVSTEEDVADSAENQNAKCVEAQVDSKVFVAPTDVAFQDMTQFMKAIAEGMQEQIPAEAGQK